MKIKASPTNSAPSRKKKDASPSKANTKQRAACIRFGNVAAASVKTEITMNAMLFIQRNDKHVARASFECPAGLIAQRKQPRSRAATRASRADRGQHNARQPPRGYT